MTQRRRYAQVGLGGRSYSFFNAVLGPYAEHCEMVAFCDSNPGRVEMRVQLARDRGAGVPGYAAADFDRMIAETRPDCVIVTPRDCDHAEYACRAMELGCDVISEKPMTTDAASCQRILDTRKRTGRECRVVFNARYSPRRSQVKRLLMDGVIGNVFSVEFSYWLDISHGADYYRRWHRNKQNSGGLLVHKATHHFDMVNWWLSSEPQRVTATGRRQFYTPQQADRYGLTDRTDRCLTCPHQEACPCSLDLRKPGLNKDLYLQHEQHDGYHRDRCVWSGDIDIEDTMNVLVTYANGVELCYSLNAFLPGEGYSIAFNGAAGRLEHTYRGLWCGNPTVTPVPPELQPHWECTRVFPHFGQSWYDVPPEKGEGGHDGGDDPLMADFFVPERPDDPLLRAADHRAGAWSILVGVAANTSIETGEGVLIENLVSGLEKSDWPSMPSPDAPITPSREHFLKVEEMRQLGK